MIPRFWIYHVNIKDTGFLLPNLPLPEVFILLGTKWVHMLPVVYPSFQFDVVYQEEGQRIRESVIAGKDR